MMSCAASSAICSVALQRPVSDLCHLGARCPALSLGQGFKSWVLVVQCVGVEGSRLGQWKKHENYYLGFGRLGFQGYRACKGPGNISHMSFTKCISTITET